MSNITSTGSQLSNSLQTILVAPDLQPGDEPSYQLCKTIYTAHPLGAKMAESPIAMAQSQQREIAVSKGPEEKVREAFLEEWSRMGVDNLIFNLATMARVYGVASIAMLSEGTPADRPISLKDLPGAKINFNVYDPLNTSGSLVLSQMPNAIDFQKAYSISVQGTAYHRSRVVILMNENPVYLAYTQSAFGYVGRSVYQRSLYPLKSFIQSMVTDDMVTLKSGVLIAKMKQPGSIIDNLMQSISGQKRELLKEAKTGNVLAISAGDDEEITTLNMQNIDGAYGMARKNILENIAVSADMPAKLLNSETFAEGFGEGTEDAKNVARYIDRMRIWLQPVYDYFDQIVMYRAWNQEFYRSIQELYPEYKKIGYTQAFYDWSNSFKASWPSLLTEPDSEKIKVDDVKLKAVIAMVQVLAPMIDPENKAALIQWAQDNFNQLKLMFASQLDLDFGALANYVPPVPDMGGGEGGEGDGDKEPSTPKPFAASDSIAATRALAAYSDAVAALPIRRPRAVRT